MDSLTMRITSGLRIGFWSPGHKNGPFVYMGDYIGPDLGEHIVGTLLRQKLMEGDLNFTVGVLFRPDRGKRQLLETVLLLTNYFPEMWNYDHWEQKATG